MTRQNFIRPAEDGMREVFEDDDEFVEAVMAYVQMHLEVFCPSIQKKTEHGGTEPSLETAERCNVIMALGLEVSDAEENGICEEESQDGIVFEVTQKIVKACKGE